MSKYIIDGRHLCTGFGGVQRYLKEILLEFDKLISPNEFTVLVPKWGKNIPEFKNLKVVRFGRLKGNLWAQFSLPFYLVTHKAKGIFLCTTVPFLWPKGIVTIHDVMMLRYPQMQKHMKKLPLFFLKMNYKFAAKYTEKIATVSNESKKDICDFLKVDPRKIVLIQNAYQHIERIKSNENIFSDYPYLNDKDFFVALSSNRWQKNFQWIIEGAKKNPSQQFVIAGGNDQHQNVQRESCDNVHYIGVLSDETTKALYQHCKAFLFPSICEGFGIPPLEALSCGAKVVCSNTSCLPEIFEDAVYYINPYDSNVDLEKLLTEKIAHPEKVLQKFSWEKSARKLLNILTPPPYNSMEN